MRQSLTFQSSGVRKPTRGVTITDGSLPTTLVAMAHASSQVGTAWAPTSWEPSTSRAPAKMIVLAWSRMKEFS